MLPTLVLALALVAQMTGAQACSTDPPSGPVPSGDPIFTTADGVRFRVQEVVTNLNVPWSLAFAPDGRLFVTERPGRVLVFDLALGTSEVALTLDDVFDQVEAGVLGLALDPDFARTRRVYLYYTAATLDGPVNRIVRYREVGNRLAERAVLLDGIPAAVAHDGGRLRFGPDGWLYATAGDATIQTDAQDLASLAGVFIRLAPDGTTPPGNPFGSPIFTYGHRNPQGFDWHPLTGELWASEHGAIGNDEINHLMAGANYGWPRIEGDQTMPGMQTPEISVSPAVAPSGASFYRGEAFPPFIGDLFVATLRGQHLWRLRFDPSASETVVAQERLIDQQYGRLRDVVPGPDGFLYVSTSNRDGRGEPTAGDDRILRLVPVP